VIRWTTPVSQKRFSYRTEHVGTCKLKSVILYSLLFYRVVWKGDRPVENINLTLKQNATHQNTKHQNNTPNTTKHIRTQQKHIRKQQNISNIATSHIKHNTIQYSTTQLIKIKYMTKRRKDAVINQLFVLQNVIIKKKLVFISPLSFIRSNSAVEFKHSLHEAWIADHAQAARGGIK
jgi:hypothetical protein